MKKMIFTPRWWAGALLAAAAVCLLLLAQGGRDQQALSRDLLRLHVVAHSDAPEDQALKLEVRDAVLAAAQPLLSGAGDRQAAIALLSAHLEDLSQAGEMAAAQAGHAYPVRASLERSWFPTRHYTGFSLPAGYYDALRVEIGSGTGQNWWCVVYPPLCQVGIEEVEAAAFPLAPGELELITQSEGEYVIRFQCAQWWGELMGWLSGE